MMIDASAIVAIIAQEAGFEHLLERLFEAERRTTTVVSAFEAVMAVGRLFGEQEALSIVREFLERLDVEVLSVEDVLLERLTAAFHNYGRRSGHPAQLNMGDCFSYAMAQSLGVALLYKGNDFAHTDLA